MGTHADGMNPGAAMGEAYTELRRVARRLLGEQRPYHSLPPTALVHEAYLRLVRSEPIRNIDRHELVTLAASVMRSVLVDHARQKRSLKRGGGYARVPLDETVLAYSEHVCDLVALDDALDRLATVDPRMPRVVELRFFGGLSIDAIATALRVSSRTVRRDWRVAKAWLRRELREDLPDEA